MVGSHIGPKALRQVGVAAGDSLDDTLAYWKYVLGLPAYARFDPPGIAFVLIGGVRLMFAPANAPGTVYLDVTNVERLHAELTARGIDFLAAPAAIHTDASGQFGAAGETEWMAFLKDPAGNTIGLVTRK